MFNDGIFIFSGGHRFTVQAAGTGRLTQSRAHPGRKFREIIRLYQAFVRLFPVSCINQVIPFRHQIVQRTSAGHAAEGHPRLAERHPALHAACPLKLLLFHGKMFMEFVKISDSVLRYYVLWHFAFILHKSCWFSHP